MSAYLISPDAYATFATLFKNEFDLLRIQIIFDKYQAEFIKAGVLEKCPDKPARLIEFMISQMVATNSQNIHQMYDREDRPMDVPLTDREIKAYLLDGCCNQRWLRAVENNHQLIVKALNWYLYQTNDRQDHTPIYRLIEEMNGKFAVQLVKKMPGVWHIPDFGENTNII
jgi:hypothetical protein